MGPEDLVSGVDRIYGVDFSGARRAGTGIWIAAARLASGSDGSRIEVERCAPAPEFLADRYDGDPTPAREPTLGVLRRFVASLDASSAIGFDFPFGLPAPVARGAFDAGTWPEQLRAVAGLDGPEALGDRCREWAAANAEGTFLKRATDAERGAFSPYHWFVVHQTYHGMAGLLAPLVARDAVRAVPMTADAAADDAPAVLETYPAATLDALGLHREEYKDVDAAGRRRRATNLEGLLDAGVELGSPAIRDRVIDDVDGDGLDGLVAAYSVARFVHDPEGPGGERRFEGHIYA